MGEGASSRAGKRRRLFAARGATRTEQNACPIKRTRQPRDGPTGMAVRLEQLAAEKIGSDSGRGACSFQLGA